MNDRPIVINAIEISYVATESGETECDGVPIGRDSIDCKDMPEELQRKIVEYIAGVERARLEMFEQLHAAYYLSLGMQDMTVDDLMEELE